MARKNAKRHLKKMGRQQARFHRDGDHVLSKRLVHNVPAGTTLVFENLSNIRETSPIGSSKGRKHAWNRRTFHSWTFAQLFAFVDYKAQERGVQVERVDPRHTSQTCGRCGYQARTNRRSQACFRCRSCSYEREYRTSMQRTTFETNIVLLPVVHLWEVGEVGRASTSLSSQTSVQGQA